MEPEEEPGSSSIPARLTYDPTQGKGTSAWQQSLEENKRLNERLRQEGKLP